MNEAWKQNPVSREVAPGYAWQDLHEQSLRMRSRPTPAERHLWQQLRAGKFEGLKFRRQHALGRFIVDFYCIRAARVIEVGGSIHDGQEEEDRERQTYLEALDLTVLRFTNEDVLRKTASVLDLIRRVVANRS